MSSRVVGTGIAGVLFATVLVFQLADRAHAASGGRACAAADLAGAIIDVQGAAGSQFGRLILVNTSSRTCRTRGFIDAPLLRANGRPLPTRVTRDRSTPSRRVAIEPGAAAALQRRWSLVPSDGRPCATARWLRVSPPHDAVTLRVAFGHAACRGDLEVRAVTEASAARTS